MQTRTRLLYLSGVAIACGVSALGGYSMGQRQGFRMGLGFLETEVNGTLGIHVEAASCIRVGDTDRALELLDGTIDAAVLSLLVQPERHHPDGALRRASLYRQIVPSRGSSAADVQKALQAIPPLELPEAATGSPPRSGLFRLARVEH
jgi:hypothetical protein